MCSLDFSPQTRLSLYLVTLFDIQRLYTVSGAVCACSTFLTVIAFCWFIKMKLSEMRGCFVSVPLCVHRGAQQRTQGFGRCSFLPDPKTCVTQLLQAESWPGAGRDTSCSLCEHLKKNQEVYTSNELTIQSLEFLIICQCM